MLTLVWFLLLWWNTKGWVFHKERFRLSFGLPKTEDQTAPLVWPLMRVFLAGSQHGREEGREVFIYSRGQACAVDILYNSSLSREPTSEESALIHFQGSAQWPKYHIIRWDHCRFLPPRNPRREDQKSTLCEPSGAKQQRSAVGHAQISHRLFL